MYKRMSAKELIDSLSDEELLKIFQESCEEYGVDPNAEWPSLEEIFSIFGDNIFGNSNEEQHT